MKSLSCHLIGMNPYAKKDFINELNNKIFNIIDLDNINQIILEEEPLDKLYKQYIKLKDDKNDKYKEVDKKMTTYWEKQFIEMVESKINNKKMNIMIGANNHYKSLTKKVPIDCTNKFIVMIDNNINELIRYNLETYKDDIIKGTYPLDYINFDFLQKKRKTMETAYIKSGYIEKTLEQIKTIISIISGTKNVGSEIWIGMKEPYNIGSMIHPKGKIIGYSDPNIALINSINFMNGDVLISGSGNDVTIKEVKPNSIKKLRTRRFLYLVDPKTFMPEDDNRQFLSQKPVKILAKQKIDSVHDYFIPGL